MTRPSHPHHTLLTLARDLGISRSTVSNAFSHPERLSAQLRARILARAAEVGYAGPDPAGRLLRGARSGAIGVLVDRTLSYAFADPAAALLLDGLGQELQLDGSGLLVHAGTAGDARLRHIRDAGVDAWIVLSLPDGDAAISAALARRRPMVILDQPQIDGIARVGIDDRAGSALAADHLLALGHRRFGVLSMPLVPDGQYGPAGPDRVTATRYRVIRERLAGVRDALQTAGVMWEYVQVIECAANDPDAGAAATTALMSAHPGLTAVIALSDQLALGALRAAGEADIHVPDQLSVIGFDDAPLAAHAYPPLTTIAQPIREKGRAAGRHVRALMAGTAGLAPEPFPVALTVRESTGPTSW